MPGTRYIRPTPWAISVRVWLTLLLYTGFTQADPATLTARVKQSQAAFLSGLEGPWQGQAWVTPVGPRPYDMTYVRTAPNRIEGQAHPGASTHYWTFYAEQDLLKLRFLSTFGGNQQPLVLTATQADENAIVFSSPRPHFLDVHVILVDDTLTKKIVLRGQPHVEINLTRRPVNPEKARQGSAEKGP